MTKQVNEYKTLPVLSDSANTAIKNYVGGPIESKIRLELEKYVQDVTPFLENGFRDMEERFNRIFK